MEAIEPLDNDSLCTPEWVLDLVRSMGPIALDPCANARSTVGALTELSLERGEDGLSCAWGPLVNIDGSIFLNPPYSKPLPWCIAAKDAVMTGCELFALVKNDPTTRWYKALLSVASARVDFSRRIAFVGGKHKSGQMSSTMFYAGSSPYLFAHTFQDVGEVRVYR
jgi:hypothetical protein